jgi:phage gp36-like protein
MGYSTNEGLLLEFTTQELARLTGDQSGVIINYDRINYARFMADSVIDAYLYGRYDVPFSAPIYPLIEKISYDLTVANLYDYAYRSTTVPQTITWRKINSVKMLKDLQSGVITLGIGSPGTDKPPFIASNRTDADKIYTDDLLDQYN